MLYGQVIRKDLAQSRYIKLMFVLFSNLNMLWINVHLLLFLLSLQKVLSFCL